MIAQKVILQNTTSKHIKSLHAYPNYKLSRTQQIILQSQKPQQINLQYKYGCRRYKSELLTNKALSTYLYQQKQKIETFIKDKVCQVIVFKIVPDKSKYKLQVQYATGFFCRFSIKQQFITKLITVFHLISKKQEDQQLLLYINRTSANLGQSFHSNLPQHNRKYTLKSWIEKTAYNYLLERVYIDTQVLEYRKRYLWELQDQQLLQPKLDLQPLPSIDYIQLICQTTQSQSYFNIDLLTQPQILKQPVYMISYNQTQGQIDFNDDDYALTLKALSHKGMKSIPIKQFINKGKNLSLGEVLKYDERFIDVKCTTNFGGSGGPLCFQQQLVGYNVGYFSDIQQQPKHLQNMNEYFIDRVSTKQNKDNYVKYKDYNVFMNIRHPFIFGRIVQLLYWKYNKIEEQIY